MKIYTATVTHKYGTTEFIARSEPAVVKKLAGYCREWWPEIASAKGVTSNRAGDAPAKGMNDQAVVEMYFAVMNDREREWYEIDNATLED